MTAKPGTLYVVATPIGNLDDITARARDVLSAVAVIAAEDTRRTGQMLTHLGIEARMLSLHEHNEAGRADEIISLLTAGKDVALVSDAGTPLISDPGYRIVARVRAEQLTVSPIPGCCAAIAALSVAGLPTDRFLFEGFLPAKSAARRSRLQVLATETATIICYESVHRIAAVLADIESIFGSDRPVSLARELTKRFETIYHGSLAAVRRDLAADSGGGKGEFTLVIGGAAGNNSADQQSLERIVAILLRDHPASQAAALAAEITGVRKSAAYRVATEFKSRG